MALNAAKIKMKSNGPKQPNIQPGSYPARLVQIIDYGLQTQKPYKGQEKQPAYEIGLTYELLDEFMIDDEGNEILDKPRWVSEKIPLHNLKADKAKSTQRYYALDPDAVFGGDFTRLINTPCMVTIVNNKSGDRVYDNVAGVTGMRPRDAKNAPKLVNEPRILSLEEDNVELFLSMPEWIQELIKESLEWESTALYKALQADPQAQADVLSTRPRTAVSGAPKASEDTSEEEEDDSIPFDVDEDDEVW